MTAQYHLTADWTGWLPRAIDILRQRAVRDVDFLEIGVYEGRGALPWLTALNARGRGSYVGIDTWGGGCSVAYPHAVHNIWQLGLDLSITTRLLHTASHKGLRQLIGEQQRFDLIYIDGSHTYENVYQDSRLAWPLLRPGGHIVWDDISWHAEKAQTYGAVGRAVCAFFASRGLTPADACLWDSQVILQRPPCRYPA
jgi:predicted O-methyltransferase YrrM